MRYLLIILCLFLTSCKEERPDSTISTSSPPSAVSNSVNSDKVDEAKKKQEEALKAGNKVAALEAERDLYKALEQQHRAEATQYHAMVKETTKALREAETEARQTKLRWIGGILGLLAIVAFGVGLWLPLTRKIMWTAAFAMVGMAALAFLFAWIVPYMLWISIGFLALFFASFIYWWRKDFKGLTQVIQAVEPLKNKFDYKPHFRQFIDTDSDEQITKIRKLETNKAVAQQAKELIKANKA